MPAKTLHEPSIWAACRAGTSHAGPLPEVVAEQDSPWSSPAGAAPSVSPIRLVPPLLVLCVVAGPHADDGDQLKPTHWAQFFSGLRSPKCSKTQPAATSPLALLCHGGQTGGGQLWPLPSHGAGGQGHQGNGTWPPPCHLCTLPAFLQLLTDFCDTVLHFLVPD